MTWSRNAVVGHCSIWATVLLPTRSSELLRQHDRNVLISLIVILEFRSITMNGPEAQSQTWKPTSSQVHAGHEVRLSSLHLIHHHTKQYSRHKNRIVIVMAARRNHRKTCQIQLATRNPTTQSNKSTMMTCVQYANSFSANQSPQRVDTPSVKAAWRLGRTFPLPRP